MWVRSQDKYKLVDVKGCYIYDILSFKGDVQEYKIFGFTHCEFYLGTYKTLEKAMSVLDKLQWRIARSESGVYQMPEED